MIPLIRKILIAATGGRLGRRIVAEANAARDRSDWTEAERLYEVALVRRPKLRWLLIQLGQARLQGGHVFAALAAWIEYLSHRETTNDRSTNLLVADLLAACGSPAGAAFHYDRAFADPERRHALPSGKIGEGTQSLVDALAHYESDLADLDRLLGCAALATQLGLAREARLLESLAELRAGGPRNPEGHTLSEVIRDLRDIRAMLRQTKSLLDLNAVDVPASLREGPATVRYAPLDVFDQSAQLIATLVGALAAGDDESVDRWLAQARDELIDRPPLISLATACSVEVRVGCVAWNSLRDFLIRHRRLAFAPIGSGALLRTSAKFSWTGLGPYCHATARLVATGADVFGWLQLAWGDQEGVIASELERGAIILGVDLQKLPANEFVEELGDYGFVNAVLAVVSDRLASGRTTRGLLERSRDACLDSGKLTAAISIQRLLAAEWSGDPVERSILRDLCRIETDSSSGTYRDELEERFARDSRRRSLRARRKNRMTREPISFHGDAERLRVSLLYGDLAPEIALVTALTEQFTAGLEFMHLGWSKAQTAWGALPILRGVEAIRVRSTTWNAPSSLEVFLDGRRIAEPGDGGSVDPAIEPPHSVVFNVWVDMTNVPRGPHVLRVVCIDNLGSQNAVESRILVEAPPAADFALSSDATVILGGSSGGVSLESRINALPSVTRTARRSFFGRLPERVLVVRADQLGDFVTSVPAIQSLREMLPKAMLFGLVAPSNLALARDLGLFSDVIEARLSYRHDTRRRHMTIADQQALRERLIELDLDLAIDLSPGAESRPLLKLSGASELVGFRSAEFPWLSLGVDIRTHDRVNGKERASHATLVQGLIESLRAALYPRWETVPQYRVRPEAMAAFGFTPDDRFALLHSGARMDFKRWPLTSFIELAKLIVKRTSLNVVLMSDTPDDAAEIEASFQSTDRLRVVHGNLPTDQFEALIGSCTVFVGNDTGPKHLASLRGAKVLSIHMGQVNWSEWGQETGMIMSRRVPCCGCGIDTTADCGKGLACLVNIQPEEAFDAVKTLILQGEPNDDFQLQHAS